MLAIVNINPMEPPGGEQRKEDVKIIKLCFTYRRSKRARDDIVHTSSRNVAIAEQVTILLLSPILPLSPQNFYDDP